MATAHSIQSLILHWLQSVLKIILMLSLWLQANGAWSSETHWFDAFKKEASWQELYQFLYNMPKGGDLHNHLSGAALPAWWYQAALAEAKRGYYYYTKVRIDNCRPYKDHTKDYLLLFQNLQKQHWQNLSACEQGEYKPLQNLNKAELDGWLRSIELDKPSEGREEFFETHWQRLNHLLLNPYLICELLFRNMQAFGDEGLLYLETQSNADGFLQPDGTTFADTDVIALYKARLAAPDALATGVTVRLQTALLRFLPAAEDYLAYLYNLTAQHSDLYVGLNMVGREDNDKGHPKRFLPTLRQLRQKHNVRLAIHAGEVDEPNYHIRDTLLLGAERIGHGLNLISDTETMQLMRHGPYLVEISLISNLLLQYVSSYAEHPFPEYLRTGIPVALSTDDRGMWGSNMTDEFYVAVTNFNLSWEEILTLSRNSISYGFVEEDVKQQLLQTFDKRIAVFVRQWKGGGLAKAASKKPVRYAFLCRAYQLCE